VKGRLTSLLYQIRGVVYNRMYPHAALAVYCVCTDQKAGLDLFVPKDIR
jgi:hypothetical protein